MSSRNYGQVFTAAITRAQEVTAGSVPVSVRQAEIIDLAITGLTVPQMRALYVAHFSGQSLPRGWSRTKVAGALREKALAVVTAGPLVRCEYVNAPAHWAAHRQLPNCRHPLPATS